MCGKEEFPIEGNIMRRLWEEIKEVKNPNATVKLRFPCKKDDPGALADLNRAWSHR